MGRGIRGREGGREGGGREEWIGGWWLLCRVDDRVIGGRGIYCKGARVLKSQPIDRYSYYFPGEKQIS